jgi:hypothetical protein
MTVDRTMTDAHEQLAALVRRALHDREPGAAIPRTELEALDRLLGDILAPPDPAASQGIDMVAPHEIAQALVAAGADAVLVGPIDRDALRTAIASVIGASAAR